MSVKCFSSNNKNRNNETSVKIHEDHQIEIKNLNLDSFDGKCLFTLKSARILTFDWQIQA